MNLKSPGIDDKFFNLLGIAALISLAWGYLIFISASGHEISMMEALSTINFAAIATMWGVMMLAMMLPSAIPMIMIYSSVNKKRRADGNRFVPTWIFTAGYLFVWLGFSLAAAAIQILLQNFLQLSEEMAIISPLITGSVIMTAGIYQFIPAKNVCLKNCKSPLDFITLHWREGKGGAILMGLGHGVYCLGCCWAIMSLLFVVGIMNIVGIAIIGAFILAEKTVFNRWLSRAAGALIIIWGLVIIAQFYAVL